MNRGWDIGSVIRPSSQRSNVIDAQYNKENISKWSNVINEEQFWDFVKHLDKELRSRVAKITYDRK